MRKLSLVHYQSEGFRGKGRVGGGRHEHRLMSVRVEGVAGEINQFIFVFCTTRRTQAEAGAEASGTKAERKKFIIKRQQKDMPGHINNNGDNEDDKSESRNQKLRESWGEKATKRVAESRSCTERIQPLLVGAPWVLCSGSGALGSGAYCQRVTHFCF